MSMNSMRPASEDAKITYPLFASRIVIPYRVLFLIKPCLDSMLQFAPILVICCCLAPFSLPVSTGTKGLSSQNALTKQDKKILAHCFFFLQEVAITRADLGRCKVNT